MHSNTLSAHQRTALVRSSQKLYKVLGDVPRVPDDDTPRDSSPAPSTWHKRKPAHLPPLLDIPDALPSRRSSVLSLSPSIVSNAPSTASSENTRRRTKLERLRRKLGHDVPTTAVFPPSPSKDKSRPRDDARSIAFSISSDESVHRVTFTTRVHKTKHITGALPPVPVAAHDSDDAGLLRARPKMGAGSMIGGADFKAARKAKREGRAQSGVAEPWELVEMVGFM